ncbi:ABC transporter permease [Methanocella sp. MCL-LM]|uniref:ABC transporter permease n=1 Tax=Methanocella sp. MCL-LM TaxID=3412035 RepID=UPI003C75E8B3
MSETMQPVTGSGWTVGLANMLKKENRLWWGDKRWLIQMIVWTAIITGLLAATLYIVTHMAPPDETEIQDMGSLAVLGSQLFFSIAGFAMVFGVIILTHDAIIKERDSGTIEWLLSKPLSRKAFVIAKLIASTIGMTLIMVLLQGALSYAVISLFHGSTFALLPFIGGLALIWLSCMFYMALLLLLGTITTSRGLVLGTSIGFYVLGGLVPMLFSQSVYLTPWKLGDIATGISIGMPLTMEMAMPIVATVVWIVIFIAGALWRVEKLEI